MAFFMSQNDYTMRRRKESTPDTKGKRSFLTPKKKREKRKGVSWHSVCLASLTKLVPGYSLGTTDALASLEHPRAFALFRSLRSLTWLATLAAAPIFLVSWYILTLTTTRTLVRVPSLTHQRTLIHQSTKGGADKTEPLTKINLEFFGELLKFVLETKKETIP